MRTLIVGAAVLAALFLHGSPVSAVCSNPAWQLTQFPPPPPPPPPPFKPSKPVDIPTNAEVATELVTRLQQTFEKLGSGDSACAASEELGDLTRDAEGALNTGQLTPAFHARLKRLLLIVRLSTYSDPGGLLAPALLPFANKELTAFVRDATGKAFNPKGPVSEQIGMVADATATEMTSLQAAAKQLK